MTGDVAMGVVSFVALLAAYHYFINPISNSGSKED